MSFGEAEIIGGGSGGGGSAAAPTANTFAIGSAGKVGVGDLINFRTVPYAHKLMLADWASSKWYVGNPTGSFTATLKLVTNMAGAPSTEITIAVITVTAGNWVAVGALDGAITDGYDIPAGAQFRLHYDGNVIMPADWFDGSFKLKRA